MDKIEQIKQDVKKIYANSEDPSMANWFYKGHIEVVAKYALEIAPKVGANPEICILSSLLHDIARPPEGLWNDPELMNESLSKAKELMESHGYSEEEVHQVQEAIRCHSCKNELPGTKEGKVVATADALAHLMTDFYFILPFNGWLKKASNFEDYKAWLRRKTRRDYKKKIFFDEYRIIATPRYEAIQLIFLDENDIIPEE